MKYIPMIALFALLCSSCNYKKVVDFPYSESIYLPAAATAVNNNGLYTITPTIQGQGYRYLVDKPNGKFNIPLGVYRSAVNPSGNIPVNISVSADTVASLITAGKFVSADPLITTEILPVSAYSLPSSVIISGDSSLANFALSVDLNFMTTSVTNFPKKRYAIAVGISNSNKTTNSLNRMVVIYLDPPSVLLPVANFTSYIDNGYKTAGFVNVSLNGSSYSWDFGDGSAISTEISPSHKYAASGTYKITLTATGITGTAVIKTASVSIL